MGKIDNSEIVFFFGAGVEISMGFPSGAAFTTKTLLKKNEDLYGVLAGFYKDRTQANYCGDYRREYLFQRNSHTFFKIVTRAIDQIPDKVQDSIINHTENNGSNPSNNLCALIKAYRKYEETNHEDKETLREEVGKVFDAIVMNDVGVDRGEYAEVTKNFSYYGSVEKDFSSIINPIETGKISFWRLINYYWQAYFVIAARLCGKDCDEMTSNDYRHFLYDLQGSVKKLWCRGSDQRYLMGSYYSNLLEKYKGSYAITTNYTPFVENVWGKGNSVYLAGKLSQMEDPERLEILDLTAENDLSTRFLFPFIMTQAMVKPIIAPKQMEEYQKASNLLRHAKVLIIIGYGLCKEDSHIVAFIRDYIINGGYVIYCAYYRSDSSKQQEKDIRLKLHLNEEYLIILHHTEIEDLMPQLEEQLNNLPFEN